MHGVTRRQVKTAAATVLAAAMIPAMSACSDQGNSGGAPAGGPSSPSASGPAKHGPMFPVCGGVSDQTVSQLTQVAGLVNTAKNSVGCQWLVNGGILGPHFSFT